MKKIFVSLALALVSVACTTDMKEDVIVNDVPESLVISCDPDAKVHLNEAVKTVWDAGDALSVFYKSTLNENWQFDGATGDRSGTISRSPNDQRDRTDKVNDIVIAYPLNYEIAISGSSLTKVEAPATQTYLADSYGKDGNVMIAYGKSNDQSFQMKSLLGWIRLSMTGTGTVTKIELTRNNKGNNNGRLAGPVTVDYKTLAYTFTGTNYLERAVLTLNCNNVILNKTTPTDFHIGVLPQTLTGGFTITVTGDGVADFTKSITKDVTVTRNKITKLEAFEYNKVETSYATPEGLQLQCEIMAMPGILDLGYTTPGEALLAADSGFMMGDNEPSGIYALIPGYSWNYMISATDASSGTITISGHPQLNGTMRYSNYVNDSTPFSIDASDVFGDVLDVTPVPNPVTFITMPNMRPFGNATQKGW